MSRPRSPLLRPQELLTIALRADETARELKRIASWLVVEAHDRGITWDEIGAAFGVSRQTVHERFGPNSRSLRRGDHGRPRDGHR
jgi:AraC-like DNA-binding protein